MLVDPMLNCNRRQSIALSPGESHDGDVRFAFRRYVDGLRVAIVPGARSRLPSLL
jgi:hypothetical protein